MITQYVNHPSEWDDMISLTLEVTYLCDKKCSYCYNPAKRYDGTNKTKLWNEVLKIKKPLKVILLGGETTFYKDSINWFNEYSEKYKNDKSKRLVFFTHGNNTKEVYNKFIGGNDRCAVGMSYHNEQTNLELYMDNVRLLRNNNVTVVVCMIVTEDKVDWEHKRNILKEVKELGCKTDICIEVNKDDCSVNCNKEYADYFKDYIYKCIVANNLIFKNKKNILLDINRNEYYLYFPNGLNKSKKICTVRNYKVNPNNFLNTECGNGTELNLNDNESKLHSYMNQQLVCDARCTGISDTLNTKRFMSADTLEDII